MSDTMLLGVLNMPYDMAMCDEMSRRQCWSRASEAATRIMDDANQIAYLTYRAEVAEEDVARLTKWRGEEKDKIIRQRDANNQQNKALIRCQAMQAGLQKAVSDIQSGGDRTEISDLNRKVKNQKDQINQLIGVIERQVASIDILTAELAELRASTLQALGEEYALDHVLEGTDERIGRHSAVRGVAVRLGIYPQLDAAIGAAIRALGDAS